MSKTLKHTCGGVSFGRLSPAGECPRCDELRNGAAPRAGWQQAYYGRKAQLDAQRLADIRHHFSSHRHVSGGCGPVCTFGEW